MQVYGTKPKAYPQNYFNNGKDDPFYPLNVVDANYEIHGYGGH